MIAPAEVFILAGGQSSRFGSNKALARFEGLALIERIARDARALPARVRAVARFGGQYDALGLETLADEVPGAGPLGGLMTALEALPAHASCIVLSCDLVGLDLDWLRRLHAAPAAPIVVFDGAPLQPLVARYAAALAPQARARVAAGRLSMQGFVRDTGTLALPPPPGWERLVNVNRTADLAGAGRGYNAMASSGLPFFGKGTTASGLGGTGAT